MTRHVWKAACRLRNTTRHLPEVTTSPLEHDAPCLEGDPPSVMEQMGNVLRQGTLSVQATASGENAPEAMISTQGLPQSYGVLTHRVLSAGYENLRQVGGRMAPSRWHNAAGFLIRRGCPSADVRRSTNCKTATRRQFWRMLVCGKDPKEVELFSRICENLLETLALLPRLVRSPEVDESVRTSLYAVDEVINNLIRRDGGHEELEILTTFRSGLVEWLR